MPRRFWQIWKNVMPKLLCTITEAFHIGGRGTVVVLEESCAWRIPPHEVVKIREAVRILRPDQSAVKTFIKGLDYARRSDGTERLIITLPNDVREEDVPGGSLLFLEREGAEPVMWDGRKAEFGVAENAVE
jgi:hypothetical protein